MFRIVLWTLLASLVWGCAADDPDLAPASASGEEKLRWHLDRIAKERDELPWVGTAKARRLRAERAVATGGARLRLTLQLAVAEVNLGNIERAIVLLEELRKAEDLAPSSRIQVALRLGTAYLRLGETENCCQRRTPVSCLLPLRGRAIHTKPRGSRRAIECFKEVLERCPHPRDSNHISARWLLSVAAMTLGQYPGAVDKALRLSPDFLTESGGMPRLNNIAQKLGVDADDLAGGVVVDDFDNDGYLDILCSTWDPRGGMHLYWNQRDGTFLDGVKAAGLGWQRGGLNLLQADYDNDGDVDVLVLRGAWLGKFGRHPNSLLRNNGDRTFTDVTYSAGLAHPAYPTQCACWGDYDNDGDLDLFVGNETKPGAKVPYLAQLFRNNGDGTFTDVARRAGIQIKAWTKGAAWGDFDNDGLLDLYVSNVDAANHLFRNNGDGTFADVAVAKSVSEPIESFPTWFWDFDNDGYLDLFVAAFPSMDSVSGYWGAAVPHQHRLYLNNRRGGFVDVARGRRLRVSTPVMGANFGDLDNDGWLDCYLGTGQPAVSAVMPNVVLRNLRAQRFIDVTISTGMGHLQKGHAVSFADLDNDGDLDVYAQLGGGFPVDAFANALFENPGSGHRWIALELVGTKSNRSAIGARIRLVVEDESGRRELHRVVGSGGSFGANPLRQTIGLGAATRLVWVEVFWPTSGTRQRFEDVAMDRMVRIVEGKDALVERSVSRLKLGR